MGGTIRIENTTSEPKTIKKHDHVSQLVPIFCPGIKEYEAPKVKAQIRNTSSDDIIKQISVDPDNIFSPEIKEKFHAFHRKSSFQYNIRTIQSLIW